MNGSFLERHPRTRASLTMAARFLNSVATQYGLLEAEAPAAAAPTPAAVGVEANAALRGFTVNHVGMAVPNIEAFLAANELLYRNFRKTSAIANERQHVREVFITDGKTTIELLEPTGEGSPLANFLKKNRAGGLVHICFDCDDIAQAIAQIKKAGGLLVTGPIPDVAFDERPIAFMMLADQVIELVQRPAA